MQDDILSQEEVIAFLDAGAERVVCDAIFRQWKYTRRGYITRHQTTYRFTFMIDDDVSETMQVFLPGLNPCTLYRA